MVENPSTAGSAGVKAELELMTAAELRRPLLRPSAKGTYLAAEVEALLERAAATIEELSARGEEDARSNVDDATSADANEAVSRKVTEMLLGAQRTVEVMKKHGRAEADAIVTQAHAEAEAARRQRQEAEIVLESARAEAHALIAAAEAEGKARLARASDESARVRAALEAENARLRQVVEDFRRLSTVRVREALARLDAIRLELE